MLRTIRTIIANPNQRHLQDKSAVTKISLKSTVVQTKTFKWKTHSNKKVYENKIPSRIESNHPAAKIILSAGCLNFFCTTSHIADGMMWWWGCNYTRFRLKEITFVIFRKLDHGAALIVWQMEQNSVKMIQNWKEKHHTENRKTLFNFRICKCKTGKKLSFTEIIAARQNGWMNESCEVAVARLTDWT